jgi:protein SCO1/2
VNTTTHPAPNRTDRRTHRPHARRRRLAFISVATALTLGVASACASQDTSSGSENAAVSADTDKFHGTLVDPPLAPAPITLRDTDGEPVRLDRRQPGTATAVFFGFTNCHDLCPTTMADLAAARRSLPTGTAENVSLVFVTVDPKRDTAAVLRAWLDQFDPDIVGLRGPVQRIHRAEDSLFASRSGKSSTPPETTGDGEHTHPQPLEEQHTHPPGSSGDGYGVDHSSIVYMFGPDETTLVYTGGATSTDYAADLTRLLRS